jgi:hypothetical protein
MDLTEIRFGARKNVNLISFYRYTNLHNCHTRTITVTICALKQKPKSFKERGIVLIFTKLCGLLNSVIWIPPFFADPGRRTESFTVQDKTILPMWFRNSCCTCDFLIKQFFLCLSKI